MAAESFENSETAALMSHLFVPIKGDREERPDLDAIYQSALALLGQHGGWPLTDPQTSRDVLSRHHTAPSNGPAQ